MISGFIINKSAIGSQLSLPRNIGEVNKGRVIGVI